MRFDRASITHWKNSKHFTNTRTGLGHQGPLAERAGMRPGHVPWMSKHLRVKKWQSPCSQARVSYLQLLPRENGLRMTAIKTMIMYHYYFFKNPESNIGIEGEEIMIVPTFHTEQFKLLEILRTVPCVIASGLQSHPEFIKCTCSIGNKYSQWLNFFEVHSRELFLY